jgi:hypothetical protein
LSPVISTRGGVSAGAYGWGAAAFDPFSFQSIATATGTGSSGTISFTSIPATYTHLQIRGIMRTDEPGATETNCYITVNGVTGTSYAYHILRGNGATVVASGGASTGFTFPGNATGAAATANVMGVLIADVLDYASTTKNKTLRYFTGFDRNGAGEVYVSSGLYNATTAITSIEIKTSSNNWTTATTFALYGIKAAA